MADQNPSPDIHSTLQEKRLFEPPEGFSSKAHVGSMADYNRLCQEAEQDPEAFWGKIAGELEWFEPWTKVLEWDVPWAKWFVGGKLNLAHNCLDRHLSTWRRNKAAIIWEGEPGEIRTLTYQQLHSEVSKFSNVLKSLGVKK
ncbi:MAG: acetyl-coenzyme A synthetase, partial [Acidobacteriota bacterium]|nr:acetyl-coenzyme A synthetase [Acidobacteriota bacterium]